MSDLEATVERLGLKDMFERSKRDGLWFWCSYQDLWFSPEELLRSLGEGRFRWGAVNWELRSPAERLEGMRRKEEAATAERLAFEERLRTP